MPWGPKWNCFRDLLCNVYRTITRSTKRVHPFTVVIDDFRWLKWLKIKGKLAFWWLVSIEHSFSQGYLKEGKHGRVLVKMNCKRLPNLEKNVIMKCLLILLVASIYSVFGSRPFLSNIKHMFLIDVQKTWHFSTWTRKPYCWIRSKTEKKVQKFILFHMQ